MTCPCAAYFASMPPCPTPVHCLACGVTYLDGLPAKTGLVQVLNAKANRVGKEILATPISYGLADAGRIAAGEIIGAGVDVAAVDVVRQGGARSVSGEPA